MLSNPKQGESLHGTVVAARDFEDTNPPLCVLSIGSEDGVQPGYRFTVYRQHRYVGEVVVTKVTRDLSGATIRRPAPTPNSGESGAVAPPGDPARSTGLRTIYGKVLVAGPEDRVFVVSVGRHDGIAAGQEVIVLRRDRFVAVGKVQQPDQESALVQLGVAAQDLVIKLGDTVMIRGDYLTESLLQPGARPTPRNPLIDPETGRRASGIPSTTTGATPRTPVPARDAPSVSALVIAAPTENGVMVLGVGEREGIGAGWRGVAFRDGALLGRVEVVRGVRGLSTMRFQSRRTGVRLEVGDQVELRGEAPETPQEL